MKKDESTLWICYSLVGSRKRLTRHFPGALFSDVDKGMSSILCAVLKLTFHNNGSAHPIVSWPLFSKRENCFSFFGNSTSKLVRDINWFKKYFIRARKVLGQVLNKTRLKEKTLCEWKLTYDTYSIPFENGWNGSNVPKYKQLVKLFYSSY